MMMESWHCIEVSDLSMDSGRSCNLPNRLPQLLLWLSLGMWFWTISFGVKQFTIHIEVVSSKNCAKRIIKILKALRVSWLLLIN